jgi:hypothetical protein
MLLAGIFMQGCCFLCIDEEFDINDPANSDYKPVYMSRAELDSSIQLLPPQNIVNSGKIYVLGDLLFIGEKREGFHVIDNSDLTNPTRMKYIQVFGSSDIAVRNNVLYINQATDLIALEYDFTQNELKLTKRIQNTFPQLSSPDGFRIYNVHQDSIIINWIPKTN